MWLGVGASGLSSALRSEDDTDSDLRLAAELKPVCAVELSIQTSGSRPRMMRNTAEFNR